MRIICIAKDYHILSTENNSVFVILMFDFFFYELLTNDIVNFKLMAPESPEGDTMKFKTSSQTNRKKLVSAFHAMCFSD